MKPKVEKIYIKEEFLANVEAEQNALADELRELVDKPDAGVKFRIEDIGDKKIRVIAQIR